MVVFDVDRARAGWVSLGVVLAVTLLFVLYSFIGTFVFGVFIYYATRPVYNRLKRFVYPKSLAAAVSILLLTLPALLLFAYLVAIGLQQFGAVTQSLDLGPFREAIGPYIDVSGIVRDPRTIIEQLTVRGFSGFDFGQFAPIQTIFTEAGKYIGIIGTLLLHLFIMLAIAFYLLRDGPKMSRWTVRRFSDEQGVLEAYLRAVDADFASIFFGNILNAILTGVIGAVSYSVLNSVAPGTTIPYPELLGLLTGIASLIPVIGMKLVYFPITVYLLAQEFQQPEHLWFVGLFFVISFLIVDTLPDFVLRPYVSGRNLHVGSVMFAYIFGPLLFGWYGIFLGPMILVLVVHFVQLVLPELMRGKPIQPYSVDPGVLSELDDAPRATPTESDSGKKAVDDATSQRDGPAEESVGDSSESDESGSPGEDELASSDGNELESSDGDELEE